MKDGRIKPFKRTISVLLVLILITLIRAVLLLILALRLVNRIHLGWNGL